MAQVTQQPQVSVVARRSWLWPVITIVVLVAIAVAVLSLAWQNYKGTAPDTFKRILATDLLQAAVITIGGAVIAALLGLIQEMRAKKEHNMAKRLELFRRMRAAHVRIVRAQGLLRG